MDGFARAIGGGIGGFVGNAAAAIDGAFHAVVAQFERIVPGGTLPLIAIALVVLLFVWYVVRH